MRKMLLTIVTVCLTMLLTGSVFAEGWTMPWDQKWTMPWDASQDARADRVPVLLGVKTISRDELEALCGDTRGLRGCRTDTWVFLQGEPSEATILFEVQYHATYKTLRAECGDDEPCWQDNILHTMEYSTKGPRSEYRMGQVGDLVNDAMNAGLPFNRRADLGRLVMGLASS